MSYSSIFWLPLCAVLTGMGLGATYYYGRRRGWRAMARGAAWSLLPIAAYLTGSIEMFWKIGEAIDHFASSFVFSPVKWAGIAVAGAAALLFVSTGGRERRKAARAKAAARAGQKKSATSASAPQPGLGDPADLGLPTGALSSGARPTVPAVRKPEPESAKTTPAKSSGKQSGAPLDDDMKDIEDILRKRGI
jgi:hypothetical protein